MKIDTIAALKRMPIGTRLLIVHSLLGPNAPKGRVLKQARSKDLVFTIDDPGSKNHGESSYLGLQDVRVESTERGFRLLEKSNGEVCAEYVFDEGTINAHS